jgi:putative addiction module component (TIGR02574 family)
MLALLKKRAIIEAGFEMETAMSHVIHDLGIDQLPIEQRVLLVQEIWDSIAREVGLLPPTQDERLELQNRMIEDDASPRDVVSWDEIKLDAKKRWKP